MTEDNWVEKVTEEFTRFLEEHDALDKFKDNLWKQGKCLRKYYKINSKNKFYLANIQASCEHSQHQKLIIISFVYTNTKEGDAYWTSLEFKWKKYCETKLGNKEDGR